MRDVLGHLVMPFEGSVTGFLVQVVRARGSIDRANAAVARELGRRPVAELTGALREHADEVVKAPGVGALGQLADGCVHLRDCARPLGLADDVTLDDWRVLLDWLSGGVVGLVPKRRLRGLRLRATDQDGAWGAGAGGRRSERGARHGGDRAPAALADLTGPGLPELRDRLVRG